MTSTFPPLAQAIAGSLGAATANIGAYPLDLITTKIQIAPSYKKKKIQGIRGVIRLLKETVRKDGLAALFEGLESDTCATLISNFFYFYAYSFLRSQLLRRRSRSTTSSKSPSSSPLSNAAEELLLGFIAGILSRAISSPLSLITVRLQSGSSHGGGGGEDGEGDESFVSWTSDDDHVDGLPVRRERNWSVEKEKMTIRKIVRDVYESDGLMGFWTGFKTTILLCSNPAITLFVFQAFRRFLLPRKNRDNPTPVQGFLGGAVASSVAICILYPLMLAKTRAQAYRSSPTSSSSLPPSSSRTQLSTSGSGTGMGKIPRSISAMSALSQLSISPSNSAGSLGHGGGSKMKSSMSNRSIGGGGGCGNDSDGGGGLRTSRSLGRIDEIKKEASRSDVAGSKLKKDLDLELGGERDRIDVDMDEKTAAKAMMKDVNENRKVDLSSRSKPTLFSILRQAYRKDKDGERALYRGLQAQLIKGVISQGFTFMVKQRIERLMFALYLYLRSRFGEVK